MFKRFKYRKFVFKTCLLRHHRINFNQYVGWCCSECLGHGPTFKVSKAEELALRQGFRVRLSQRNDYV